MAVGVPWLAPLRRCILRQGSSEAPWNALPKNVADDIKDQWTR